MLVEPIPVSALFEAHLTVSDLDRSIAFYRDVVGLQLASKASEIGAAFLWVGSPGDAMLGLWTRGSAPMRVSLHVAFKTSLGHVLGSTRRLRALGVTPLAFDTTETDEPSVIGWMPAAAIYFRDPDGHLLEYLAMLEGSPDPERRIIPWSEWGGLVKTQYPMPQGERKAAEFEPRSPRSQRCAELFGPNLG